MIAGVALPREYEHPAEATVLTFMSLGVPATLLPTRLKPKARSKNQ